MWVWVFRIARHDEAVLREHGQHLLDLVAGIDDEGLLRGRVPDHGAVALEEADGKVSTIIVGHLTPVVARPADCPIGDASADAPGGRP